MKDIKVLFSGFIGRRLSKFGGYDKITDIPLKKKILLLEDYKIFSKKNTYSILSFIFLELFTNIFRFKYNITHYFYGEGTKLKIVPLFRIPQRFTVATIHMNIEDERKHKKRFLNYLRRCDGIIVLSSQQKKVLKEKYNIDSEFIPHGFYEPKFQYKEVSDMNDNNINKNKINIITIGVNYRDYETFLKVIEKYQDNEKFAFHLVGVPQRVKEQMKDYKICHIYDRLNDDEFYSIISDMDYGFLPLTFATANNTVMESQFLNLKGIYPNIEGIKDYAAPSPYNFFYNDINELYNIFDNLNKYTKDNYLYQFAKKNFEWKNIFTKIENYYSRIVNTK